MDVMANNKANGLKLMEKADGKLVPAEPKDNVSINLFIDVVLAG
jgi:hypothetical protein